jgi:hypothetical protein
MQATGQHGASCRKPWLTGCDVRGHCVSLVGIERCLAVGLLYLQASSHMSAYKFSLVYVIFLFPYCMVHVEVCCFPYRVFVAGHRPAMATFDKISRSQRVKRRSTLKIKSLIHVVCVRTAFHLYVLNLLTSSLGASLPASSCFPARPPPTAFRIKYGA